MNTPANSKPRILLLDDQVDYPQAVTLPELAPAFDVTWLTTTQDALERCCQAEVNGLSFDLVILDLTMAEPAPASLQPFANSVTKAMRGAGFSSELSAQALGLWLWNRPTRQPYCYLTSYRRLHMPGLEHNEGPAEFLGADAAQMDKLVCERGTEGDSTDFVRAVKAIWTAKAW